MVAATGGTIGDSKANLKAALLVRHMNIQTCIKAWQKTARDEGFDEIADWFETLAKAERSHANRFTKALENMN